MALALTLTPSLTQTQQLRLSASLTQSLKLLQTPYLELRQTVEALVLENPFLELAENVAVDADLVSDADKDADAVDKAEHEEWSFSASSPLGGDAGYEGAEEAAHTSLQAHLRAQLAGIRLSSQERLAVEDMMDGLDDDGYLRGEEWQEVDDADTSETLPSEEQQALHRFALHLLQSLEPAGVGARSLSECLILQLKRLQGTGGTSLHTADKQAIFSVALRICQTGLNALAQRRWQTLANALQTEPATVQAAHALIQTLYPKPGQVFARVRPLVRIPEVEVLVYPSSPRLVVRSVSRFGLQLQERLIAQWRSSPQIQEARWWCRALAQREATLLRITEAIAHLQEEFFRQDPSGLKPLGLARVAAEIGMHESTVSRAIQGKYLRCARGVFELRYFFTSTLRGTLGVQGEASDSEEQSTSSHQVRALMQEMLASENPHKPLSDQKIADLLAQKGVQCARRTVAKYREAMGVLPAKLRKKA